MTTTPAVGPVRSGFGKRKALIPGMTTDHKGVDLGVPIGTPVIAPQDGVVTVSRYSVVRGHYVVVDHGDGWATLHQHLSKRLVSRGDRVQEGVHLLGLSGRTGNVTGAHLHTEVQDHGVPIDPVPWYLARGVVLGSASRVAVQHTTRPDASEEDDMRILVCHDSRRGYWLVAPGHAHQFNQNPAYPEEFTGFMARHPGIPVVEYPAGDAGVRALDIDKAVFTQTRL